MLQSGEGFVGAADAPIPTDIEFSADQHLRLILNNIT